MKYARETLYYPVVVIFVVTSFVTVLGILGVVSIEQRLLNVLVSVLIIDSAVAVIALFKATDWFGHLRRSEKSRLIEGNWWQLIRHNRENALSSVQIRYDEEQQQVILVGDAYSQEGTPHAEWWSISASLNAATLELYYFWNGDREHDVEDFAGVGWMEFHIPAGSDKPDRGNGWYTSGNLEPDDATEKTKFALLPISNAHLATITSDSSTRQEKGKIAAQVYADWK